MKYKTISLTIFSIFIILSLILRINIIFILLLFICSTVFSFICFLNAEIFPNSSKKVFTNKPGLDFIQKKIIAKKDPRVIDQNITGYIEVDQILQNIIQLIVRDYISTWYNMISPVQDFPVIARTSIQEAIKVFSQCALHVNWVEFFSLSLVDELATHFRIFKKANESLQRGEEAQKLEGIFFDLEAKMMGMSRERICLSPEVEKEYLVSLCEMIMFEIFPSSIFECVSVRYLIRTILVENVLTPLMSRLSEPDFINQNLNYLLLNFGINKDSLTNIVKTAIMSEEADALIALLDGEIDKYGSKDTGGSGVSEVKQTLSSLKYLKYLCLSRLEFLNNNYNVSEDTLDGAQLKQYLTNPTLYNMSFEEMLDSAVAMGHFTNYLSEMDMSHYMFFYSNCVNFFVSVQQFNASPDYTQGDDSAKAEITKSIRKTALNIYENYLSAETELHITLDDAVIRQIENGLNCSNIPEDMFASACEVVHSLMQNQYFDSFKHSTHYAASLLDLGLIAVSMDDSTHDACSGMKVQEGEDSPIEKEEFITVCGYIYDSETVVDGLTSHRLYKLDCNETWHSTGKIKCRDEIIRRYLHFSKFNKILRERVDNSYLPELPLKKLIVTSEEEYKELEIKLNIYLKSLSNPSFQRAERRIYHLLNEFLQPCPWSACEAEIKRKFPNIRDSPRKSGFSSFIGGLLKPITPRRDASPSFSDISDHVRQSKLNETIIPQTDPSAVIDSGAYKFEQDDDNIPLRIILLFADELFDLKTENRWIRRRMVVLFREVIKATYGDTINKKIVDQMRWLVSRDQVVFYLKTFRDSFWPGGIAAEVGQPRDRCTKMRTRVVTRCKMLAAIPDEVRTLVGQHTVKRGVTHVFNMFQVPILNRRLAYVLVERFVECLFQNRQIMNSLYNFHSKN